MARRSTDLSMLEMALIGYQAQKEKLELSIRELRAQLDHKKAPAASGVKEKPKVRRKLSAAARKRIAAAQRKRWAEHRKRQKG